MRAMMLLLHRESSSGRTMQSVLGQQARIAGLNHIGIVVDNLDEARAFYTKTMGFREAWRNNGLTTFVQVNRDTFLELLPATPTRRAGLDHFGFLVEDAHATTARLKEAGLTVSEVPHQPVEPVRLEHHRSVWQPVRAAPGAPRFAAEEGDGQLGELKPAAAARSGSGTPPGTLCARVTARIQLKWPQRRSPTPGARSPESSYGYREEPT